MSVAAQNVWPVELITSQRLARLEGRMDRIEDKLDTWLHAGPIVASFVLGAAIGWTVAR